jgi:hypothetical protein
MKSLRSAILAFVLVVVALVLVLPQVDLPDAVSVNRNAATLVGKSLAPNAPVSARSAPLPHLISLHGFGSEKFFAAQVVLHPQIAPTLNLLCTLRC